MVVASEWTIQLPIVLIIQPQENTWDIVDPVVSPTMGAVIARAIVTVTGIATEITTVEVTATRIVTRMAGTVVTGAIVVVLLHEGIRPTTDVAEAIQEAPHVVAALPEVVVTMTLPPRQVRVRPRFPLRLTAGKGILCTFHSILEGHGPLVPRTRS